MELISIILNFLLASGLAGTLVFFNSKRRRERAAADSAELENTEKVVDHNEGEERSGVMSIWVWIMGFGAVIVVALAIGMIKKR